MLLLNQSAAGPNFSDIASQAKPNNPAIVLTTGVQVSTILFHLLENHSDMPSRLFVIPSNIS